MRIRRGRRLRSLRTWIITTAVVFFCLSGLSLPAQQTPPDLLERYARQGEEALAAERYEDAAQAYEKLRELDPRVAEVHARLGLIYFQQRKFAQAVAALRRAVALKPGLPNIDILLAMSLSELGRHQEALPGLEKGFQQSADKALKRMCGLELQRAYTNLRRDSDAVKVALELVQLYPEDGEILYHAGRVFGNFAYLTMVRLSEVAPNSVWSLQALGDANQSLGAYDRAIDRYRQVLAADPNRPGVHFQLGRVLLARAERGERRAEDLAAAAQAFEREVELDPTNANAAYELAELHRQAGRLEKARELFETALNYYPAFAEAQIGLAKVLITARQPEKALNCLRKAISQEPGNEVPYYLLSQVYGMIGNKEEQQKAIAEYRRLRTERSRREDLLLQRAVTSQGIDLDRR